MVAALGDIRTLADDCCGQGASTLGPAKASGGVGGTSDPDVGASSEELLGESILYKLKGGGSEKVWKQISVVLLVLFAIQIQ